MNENDIRAILDASSAQPPAREPAPVDPAIEAEREAILAGSSTGKKDAGEATREVGIGTAQGFLEGTAMIGSPYLGTKAGMAAGAPFGPIGIGVGGALGFAAGATAGVLAQDPIKGLFPAIEREDLAPYREGGRTFGQSMAAAPYAWRIPVDRAKEVAFFLRHADPAFRAIPDGVVAGKTGEFVFKTLAAAGETARKYPKSFLAGEAAMGAGAGVMGGISEAYYPGEPGTRMAFEVAGGFLAPGRQLFTTTGNAKDFLVQLGSKFSKDAREQRVADKMRTMLDAAGEDPNTVYRELMRDDLTSVPLTAAQKSRSGVLSALQTTLARNNVEYGAKLRKQAEDAYRAHALLIQRLQSVGTPDSLAFAAQQRDQKFRSMIQERVALAEGEAARRILGITKDTPAARGQIGEIVKTQTERALRDVREHEQMLWNHAYRDAVEVTTDAMGREVVNLKKVRPSNIGEEFLKIATSMTEARYAARMPKEIKDIMRTMGVDNAAINRYRQGQLTQEYLDTGRVPDEYLRRPLEPEPSLIELPPGVTRPDVPEQLEPVFRDIDAQELIKARGDLLSFARDASARGEFDNANFYGRLAEAVLDDLQQLNTPAYDAARQFSYTVNDMFRRTYAGDIAMSKARSGADRVPAELLVNRAFTSNADLTLKRMLEIQDAVGMMSRQYDDAVARFGVDSPQARELQPFAEAATQRVDSILDAQQRAMRLAAAKAIDPQTGRVNTGQLQRFVNENQLMLDQLGITPDLSDAIRSENAFRAISDQNSFINNRLYKETAFAQVLARENPVRAVGDVLNSSHPVKNFQRIVQLAKSGGPDAVDGLKATMYDYAFTKAGGIENFDVAAFKKAMFDPLGPNKPSIVNMMRSQGVLSREEIRRMLQLMRPMERIMELRGNQALMNDLVENADAITEFGLRVLGSKIGRFAAPAGSSSLIAAQAGSSAVRNIFDKQPNILIRGQFQHFVEDGTAMGMLLRRGDSRESSLRLARGLHGYLAAAGLNYADYEEPPEVDRTPANPRAAELLRQLPPAPVTRGTPNLQMPTPPQGPAGEALERMPTDQGPAGPVSGPVSTSREMFQRLFPNEMS